MFSLKWDILGTFQDQTMPLSPEEAFSKCSGNVGWFFFVEENNYLWFHQKKDKKKKKNPPSVLIHKHTHHFFAKRRYKMEMQISFLFQSKYFFPDWN